MERAITIRCWHTNPSTINPFLPYWDYYEKSYNSMGGKQNLGFGLNGISVASASPSL
ncbi:hypothetical protein [Wolbachia endosymbiont (group A) of Sphecodes monilicornis]|uniref:hypothetical protein n=1 Tax=Wolbachia endosymbiont (group A) of Sphecodes monilicornis TaxID=2954060 RepID=UPI0022280838|nr:hypothetical protein [Wolbachia endosymbiont (group A) of Sphecodes monilicornis]